MKNIFFILMLFLLSGTVIPQSSDSTGRVGDRYIIQVNDLSFPIESSGAISDFEQVRFNGDMILYSAGFFLAGKTGNSIWASIQSSPTVEDYIPGAINDSLNLSKGIFVLRRSDPPFGKSWQDWRDAVHFGAMFYDGDSDGVYNPVDKNLDSVWNDNEDMPYLLGDITAWCVYNDGVPYNQRRMETSPSGIEIRQTIFASNEIFLQNSVLIIYSIINRGVVSDSLSNVYFAIRADPDIGTFFNDDLSGCDTISSTGFVYDNPNEIHQGNNSPAVFLSILQGPVIKDSSAGQENSYGVNNFGKYYGQYLFHWKLNLRLTSFQRTVVPLQLDWEETRYTMYNRLQGFHPEGGLFNPCIFDEGMVVPDTMCSYVNPLFMFSGDPVTGTGWLDTSAYDQRVLLSTGPFDLIKDKPQNIIIAYTAMRGNDALDAVRRGKMLVSEVIREYDSNFVSLTYEAVPTSTPSPNQLIHYKLYQNYPNPFNPMTTIRYEIPQDGLVTIEVFDILGQKVRTLVNKFQKADRYEIKFDGSSLASGIYIYRMKVNDFITSKKMVLIK